MVVRNENVERYFNTYYSMRMVFQTALINDIDKTRLLCSFKQRKCIDVNLNNYTYSIVDFPIPAPPNPNPAPALPLFLEGETEELAFQLDCFEIYEVYLQSFLHTKVEADVFDEVAGRADCLPRMRDVVNFAPAWDYCPNTRTCKDNRANVLFFCYRCYKDKCSCRWDSNFDWYSWMVCTSCKRKRERERERDERDERKRKMDEVDEYEPTSQDEDYARGDDETDDDDDGIEYGCMDADDDVDDDEYDD